MSDGEEEAKDNGNGCDVDAEPAKISSSLFRRRKEREVNGAGDDISVDADFFNRAKPNPEETTEMNVDESDGGAKSRGKEGKISLKLFEKKKGKKREEASRQMADSEDSVDMDFLAANRKRPLNEGEKPLSPQLFKPSKRRKRGGAAAAGKVKSTKLSYDSDSLDVDVLSSLAAKSSKTHETSPNAFAALMKKPLAENYCGKYAKVEGASNLAQSDVSPTGNKENAKVPSGSEERKEVKNNAFARLMTAAKKKGVWEQEQEEEQIDPTTSPITTMSGDDKVVELEANESVELDDSKHLESECEGNPNAFARLMKAAKAKDAWRDAAEETRSMSRPASPAADPSVGEPKLSEKQTKKGKKKKTKAKRARPRSESDNDLKEENSGVEKACSRPQTPKNHGTPRSEEAELVDDEETRQEIDASCGRRSSRIQKNREAMEKKRKEREEAEKLLDEQGLKSIDFQQAFQKDVQHNGIYQDFNHNGMSNQQFYKNSVEDTVEKSAEIQLNWPPDCGKEKEQEAVGLRPKRPKASRGRRRGGRAERRERRR